MTIEPISNEQRKEAVANFTKAILSGFSVQLDITYDLDFILSCEPTVTVLLGKLCTTEGKDFDSTSHRLRQEVEKIVEAKAVQVVEESYLAQLKFARLVA